MSDPHTVLLVEDDVSIRAFLALNLERMGLTVVQASDGGAAVEQLHLNLSIVLIVTDLIMPGMSGLDLARHVRTMMPAVAPGRGRNVPIIMLTAHKDRATEGARIGDIQMVLEKPIRYDAFRQAVSQFLPVK